MFEDSKKSSLLIFSLLFLLLLAIGSISAADDNSLNSTFETCDLNIDDEDDVDNLNDFKLESSAQDASENLSQEETPQVLSTNDSGSSDLQNQGDLGAADTTKVSCSPKSQKYTSGYTTYQVCVYDNVNVNGVNYKSPKYYTAVKIRVYTGSAYKNYQATIGATGNAQFKIPNLSLGTHKVQVYYNNVMKLQTTLKIVKTTTTVYAPVKTLKYKKNTYYKIRVLDSHGVAAKKIVLKVKVFTGKKSKTYSIKTTAKGIAKLKTRYLGLGVHKITIKTNYKRYKISKTTKIYIKRTVPKTKEKVTVTAPAVTVQYKKASYFTMTAKNSYGYLVKKLVLKVKVFTGKKSKTYSVKTNTKGVANLNTKSLAVGTHKVTITTNNKNYKVSKTSKIIVKKTVTDNTVTAPALDNLLYYPSGNGYQIKLSWNSKSGSTYQVMKKTIGDYEPVATVKATSTNTVFYQSVNLGDANTYTVRELLSSQKLIGPYDKTGLTMLTAPDVDVDFQNLKAVISWNKIAGATNYRIFRKMGLDGDFECIATVNSGQTTYTDYYYNSVNKLSEIMNSNTFIEASFNNLVYTVRACKIDTVNSVQKVSYGLYLRDGDFNLESPTVVYLKNNTITWGKVPNAEGYRVLKRMANSTTWEVIGEAGSTTSTVKSLEIGAIDNTAYYAVQAYATKNGVKVYSNYDKGFSLKHYSTNNSVNRILYFGDSISFGSPYYSSSSIHIFSMAHRVAQLTGCVYYNPSIPGSTYHDLGVNPDGTNVENTNYYRYRIPREVVDQIAKGDLPANWEELDTAKNSEGVTNTKITDYNIVVLAAGTNDYLDNSIIGSADTRDTSTFNGGINHIMDQVKKASDERVEMGLTPIRVVFVDLFYSDRTYNYKYRNNRDVTPNQIGLTLMDYQKELDKQIAKWSDVLEVYNFNTRDYDIVNHENCPYTSSDNLHFTKFTYGQYGNVLAEFFVNNVFFNT